MEIRNAQANETDAIMEMMENAKRFMATHGNPDQWNGSYPERELIEEDIRLGRGYVCAEGAHVYAYFMLLKGDEPDYRVIDGAWLNDLPYMTLHRIASTGERPGMADLIVRWSLLQCQNLRGDTYKDNLPMQRAFERNGFLPCGTIWIDGRKDMPRIAYHRPPKPGEAEGCACG